MKHVLQMRGGAAPAVAAAAAGQCAQRGATEAIAHTETTGRSASVEEAGGMNLRHHRVGPEVVNNFYFFFCK